MPRLKLVLKKTSKSKAFGKWVIRDVQPALQAPAHFKEVAVYFTESEWICLEEGQKELYKEVMLENYLTFNSLGYLHKKPDIISRIERDEDPCLSYNKDKRKSFHFGPHSVYLSRWCQVWNR
ncbi:protein ZNF783 isoform X5 [Xenopus tropicalis]|uniref:Protein ZNF783 isoform X5 n=1 Tax=Xenopus tropicalis TaxID=8364 RepID=A0A8J1IML4_XENTR|nr:protein ZNF783 isoform X5 [Xenopus tropicalis]